MGLVLSRRQYHYSTGGVLLASIPTSDCVYNSHGAEGGLAFCRLTLPGSIGRFSYGAAALWAPDAGMQDIHFCERPTEAAAYSGTSVLASSIYFNF